MQRTLGTLLVAVMVVFAGCGGVLGGGSDESVKTFTPAPDPTPKPTPTPVPQLAPGLTGEGIKNANTLIWTHTSFLQNRSFTKTTNTTVLAPNGSVVARGTETFRMGPAGEKVYSISKWNISSGYLNSKTVPVRVETWWSGGRVFLKRTYANGTTTYARYMAGSRYGTSGAGLRSRLEQFGIANTSVVKQSTENGTTLYRVRGTTRVNRTFMRRNVSLRLRLLVDSRGVIHKYRIIRQPIFNKSRFTVIYEVEFSKIGATDAPERPSWVDEALNRTTPIPEDPRGPYDESGNSTDTNRTASKTTTSG